jgi:SAM-dependent methyltransferase
MSADGPTPAVQATPDPIFQIVSGYWAAKLLFVANEVQLFERLADWPASLGELAERTGVAPRRLRILVDAMVAQGLVERQADRYQNGPVAAAYLSGQASIDLRPYLRFENRLGYPAWIKLEEIVRSGRIPGQGTRRSPDEQRLFSEGVAALMAAPAQALPISYDFTRHRRLLDLGGGTGSWLIPLLQQTPDLHATLFDLPSAAALARELLAANAATHNAEVVEGNFFEDPIPTGHDVILAANVIHLFAPERIGELLRRIRASASTGARLLVVDWWTDPTHTQPSIAPLVAGGFLLTTGEGDVYSTDEGYQWLQESGWEPLESKPLVGPLSLIVAEAV